MRRSCVNLRGRNGRHSRLERLIGSAVPVYASLSAGLRPSTITVGVNGNVMTCYGAEVGPKRLMRYVKQ